MSKRIVWRGTSVVLGILTSAVLVPAVQFAASADEPSLRAFAVSDPAHEGQEEVQMLRQALSARNMSNSGIQIFRVPTKDGLATVLTRHPDQFTLRPEGGGLNEVLRVESALPHPPALPVEGSEARVAAASKSDWVRNNADCDIYSTEGFARTQCFEINQQAGDTDPARAFWQYTAEATGHSKGGRKMDRMWVERKPTAGSARQEFDGIPEPKEARNRVDNCVQQTEGIAIQSGAPVQIGFSKNWSRTTCETYRPKMYDDEGHWATIWEGNPSVKQKDSRHVLFTMPVKTADGALPSWVRLNGQHTTR